MNYSNAANCALSAAETAVAVFLQLIKKSNKPIEKSNTLREKENKKRSRKLRHSLLTILAIWKNSQEKIMIISRMLSKMKWKLLKGMWIQPHLQTLQWTSSHLDRSQWWCHNSRWWCHHSNKWWCRTLSCSQCLSSKWTQTHIWWLHHLLQTSNSLAWWTRCNQEWHLFRQFRWIKWCRNPCLWLMLMDSRSRWCTLSQKRQCSSQLLLTPMRLKHHSTLIKQQKTLFEIKKGK